MSHVAPLETGDVHRVVRGARVRDDVRSIYLSLEREEHGNGERHSRGATRGRPQE